MRNERILANAEERLKLIHTKDIKLLVQQKGKLIEGTKELSLKEPSPTNPKLNTILNDPYCEIRAIEKQPHSGIIRAVPL